MCDAPHRVNYSLETVGDDVDVVFGVRGCWSLSAYEQVVSLPS